MSQTDLFGADPTQGELFGTQVRESREWVVNADTVRAKMHNMLNTAKQADIMPWSPRKVRIYETIFPQMANWLPEGEGEQLCLEFAQELDRLKNAA